ncbi:LuxR C-terminal-related transcriptional regulator [Rhizorhabdus histidinilytica]
MCIGILTGHTSESIARNLSISVNSVLTYRKRLYEKLEISSQNELFVRIIDSLMRLNWDAKDLPAAGGGLEINASRARLKGRPLAADLDSRRPSSTARRCRLSQAIGITDRRPTS